MSGELRKIGPLLSLFLFGVVVVFCWGWTSTSGAEWVRDQRRTPATYDEVKHVVNDFYGDVQLKILVFGCSTSEEVVWFAGHLFPLAIVVGVDIDEETLSIARRSSAEKGLQNRTFYFNSLTHPLSLLGRYDIVFADSVLCRHPWFTIVKNPFRVFESTLGKIIEVVNPHGILVVIQSSYRVEDTQVASCFRPHKCSDPNSRGCRDAGKAPIHAPDGTRVENEHACIYSRLV